MYTCLGNYDGFEAFSCIANIVLFLILTMFSALLIDAAYNNHPKLIIPWLFGSMLMLCNTLYVFREREILISRPVQYHQIIILIKGTRDIYALIQYFFDATSGDPLGIVYALLMVATICKNHFNYTYAQVRGTSTYSTVLALLAAMVYVHYENSSILVFFPLIIIMYKVWGCLSGGWSTIFIKNLRIMKRLQLEDALFRQHLRLLFKFQLRNIIIIY